MFVYKRLRFTAFYTMHCDPFLAIFVIQTSLGFILGKNQDLNTIADGLWNGHSCLYGRREDKLMVCCIVWGQRFQKRRQSLIIWPRATRQQYSSRTSSLKNTGTIGIRLTTLCSLDPGEVDRLMTAPEHTTVNWERIRLVPNETLLLADKVNTDMWVMPNS